MFQAAPTRIALAAAAALAIVAASFVPAATFASPLAPSQDDVMVAKPDLKITMIYSDVATGKGGSTIYGSLFAENIGNAPANPVALKVECSRYDAQEQEYKKTGETIKLLPILLGGEHAYTNFNCLKGDGVRLTLMTPNDSNLGNNVENIGYMGGN